MSLLDLPLEVLNRIITTPEMYAAVRGAARAFASIKFIADLEYYFYDTVRDWKLSRTAWLDHIRVNLRAAPKFTWVYSVKIAGAPSQHYVFMIASTRDRVQLRNFLAATA